MKLPSFLILIVLSFCIPCGLSAADWITAPSYYSHDPMSGQRVNQYSRIGPFYNTTRSDYTTSGYRHTRSSIEAGGSVDHLHLVETWGRPVRPYEEWKYPFRPYSVPYQQWGPQPVPGMGYGIGGGGGGMGGGGSGGGGMNGGGMGGGGMEWWQDGRWHWRRWHGRKWIGLRSNLTAPVAAESTDSLEHGSIPVPQLLTTKSRPLPSPDTANKIGRVATIVPYNATGNAAPPPRSVFPTAYSILPPYPLCSTLTSRRRHPVRKLMMLVIPDFPFVPILIPTSG